MANAVESLMSILESEPEVIIVRYAKKDATRLTDTRLNDTSSN